MNAWGLTDDDEEDGFEVGGNFSRVEMRRGWMDFMNMSNEIELIDQYRRNVVKA